MTTDGRYDTLSKKEIARLDKERRKLAKNLDGIRGMGRLPDAVFIVDTRHEQIAVDEARKLKIPVIGVVDTNCDPDEVDYVIPGNDDALRSIRLFAAGIADAVLAGRGIAEAAAPPKPADAKPRADRSGHRVGRQLPQVQRSQVRRSDRGPPEHAGYWPRSPVTHRGTDAMAEIPAALVKQLRDATGAGMMECKAALQEANGDLEEATLDPPQARPRPGGQEVRPLDQRGPDRLLHPHGRQDWRAGRAQLRVGLRGAHRRLPDAARANCRCRSPPPTRSTSAARTCRPTCSNASGASIARRWRTPASRRRSSTRSSKASSAASTNRSCLVDQPSIRDPKQTVGAAAPGRHRQARREHQRRALRPLQGRRTAEVRPRRYNPAVGVQRPCSTPASS